MTELERLLELAKDCDWYFSGKSIYLLQEFSTRIDGEYAIYIGPFSISVYEIISHIYGSEAKLVLRFSHKWYRPSTWGIRRLWLKIRSDKKSELQAKMTEADNKRRNRFWEKMSLNLKIGVEP